MSVERQRAQRRRGRKIHSALKQLAHLNCHTAALECPKGSLWVHFSTRKVKIPPQIDSLAG